MIPAFMGPSGLDTSLQALLARNKVSFASAVGNGTTLNSTGLNVTGTGTATALNVAATNIFTAMRSIEYPITTAAAAAVAGWRSASAQFFRGTGKLGGFFFVCRFGRSRGAAANATLRGFTGLAASTAAPTDVDPSTFTDVLGVGCDAGDTNWQVMHRTGSGAVTKVDTGIPKAVADSSEMYEVAMFCPPGGTVVHVQFTRLSDDATFTHTITTNLPAANTLLAPRGHYSVGGTSAVIGYALSSAYIETDY